MGDTGILANVIWRSLQQVPSSVDPPIYRDFNNFYLDPYGTPINSDGYLNEITDYSGLFWDMDTMSHAAPFTASAGENITTATGPIKAADTICTVREQLSAHYVGGSVTIGGVERRIIWVSTVGLEDNQVKPADDTGTWATLGKTKLHVTSAWGQSASVGDILTLKPPSSLPDDIDDAVDFLGYGATGTAFPTQQPTSGWGTAFSMDELQLITHTAGADVCWNLKARAKPAQD
eukprot:COSAG02_NODE_53_length_44062_cov_22.860223_7_plen_233_part_00